MSLLSVVTSSAHPLRTLAFDPKPFIRTLEAAVDQLISVRKDVQTRTEQMEKSVKVAEREYSKKMAELNRGFDVSLT
jgi:exocyst complex component 5